MNTKKVYVLCPKGLKTGGPELLHQLVFTINRLNSGSKAYLTYTSETSGETPVEAFHEYIVDSVIEQSQIEDSYNNIIIFPETNLNLMHKFKNAKKYIWWLSVDNFLIMSKLSTFSGYRKERGILRAVKHALIGDLYDTNIAIESADKHLCQSVYAINYVKNLGISDDKIEYLADYINDLYVKNSSEYAKRNKISRVLYNPKKGKEFTQKLIDMAPESIKWVPLINLSNEQVADYLSSSKLYIDFGNHPGMDRFPREAATCGCCVITDKRGSAKFKEDVNIPDQYKFEDKEENIPAILKQIEYCLANYDVATKDFENYRSIIKGQKSRFTEDVKKIFGE
ncbi:hypothetical protein [Lactobacillus delbrueckii]|uniref:hypothetical protein n=1 Tax=Lactobacillus delbrueckii TaxID=1584 RepID=UPI002550DCCD|nr:hypothetical protein [Lactobacillus delbrueckii]MDK8261420.1 hypothetical protein [Lactobacillus delbrueckii]